MLIRIESTVTLQLYDSHYVKQMVALELSHEDLKPLGQHGEDYEFDDENVRNLYDDMMNEMSEMLWTGLAQNSEPIRSALIKKV